MPKISVIHILREIVATIFHQEYSLLVEDYEVWGVCIDKQPESDDE